MENLAFAILEHKRTRPEQPAVQSETRVHTYAELEEAVKKAASALQAMGITQGSVVGLALRDAHESLIVMMGAWMLGATCNMIDFRTPAPAREELAKTFHHDVFIEDKAAEGAYRSVSRAEWDSLIASAPAAEITPCETPAAAAILLTSGSTGKPAGFKISHRAVFARYGVWRGTPLPQAYTRVLSAAPLSFGANLGWVKSTLLHGGSIVFFPPVYRPQDLAAAIRKHQITGVPLVPTALRDLLAYARETGETISTPTNAPFLTASGAAISSKELEAMRKYLSPNVVQVYASSPVGAVSAIFCDELDQKGDTVGRPLSGVDVEIVDDNHTPLPPNSIGQIRVRTPSRADSIIGRDARSGGDRFEGDWYYPNDVGLIDDEGYLKLMGRSSEVIIRGGVNIYPQELEHVIATCTGVKEVAALGYPDARAGEEIAIFAVVDPGLTAEDLLAFCRKNLTADKRPKRVLIVAEFPLNPNGKVMKRKLARLLEITEETEA